MLFSTISSFIIQYLLSPYWVFDGWRLDALRSLSSPVGEQVVNVGTTPLGLSCVRNTVDGCTGE